MYVCGSVCVSECIQVEITVEESMRNNVSRLKRSKCEKQIQFA